MVPRPRMHDLVPGDRDLVEREQRLDAGRRARHRARHHEREAAHVDRVHAVDVLVGIHLEQRGVEVDLRRRRVLDEEAVDQRVVVERAHGGDHVGLRRVLRAGAGAAPTSPSSRAFSIFMPT